MLYYPKTIDPTDATRSLDSRSFTLTRRTAKSPRFPRKKVGDRHSKHSLSIGGEGVAKVVPSES